MKAGKHMIGTYEHTCNLVKPGDENSTVEKRRLRVDIGEENVGVWQFFGPERNVSRHTQVMSISIDAARELQKFLAEYLPE